MTVFLTREEIVNITGVENLERLPELEILFTSFDELGALEYCQNLRRLTCIDNGMKKMSNLLPVAQSLQSLCLCDQGIVHMEGLELPNLRELFLHRNKITRIGGLEGCPRLKRLWLFQNKLRSITGLHAVPELQECWLQGNSIKSLKGIETCVQLSNLGLAGNLLSDFNELRKLAATFPKLKELSLSDIHFGRCPIVDEPGYKEFAVLHLKQVKVLDGVSVSKEMIQNAEDAYYQEVKEFNDALREVEDEYQMSIKNIENQHQSQESYASVLEREMSAALKELQSLVEEARSVIGRQVSRNKSFIIGNFKHLSAKLNELEMSAKTEILASLGKVHQELDEEAATLSMCERVSAAEAMITDVLCGASEIRSTNAEAHSASKRRNVYFQAMGHSSADYTMIGSNFAAFSSSTSGGCGAGTAPGSCGANASSTFATVSSVELLRLFKVATVTPADMAEFLDRMTSTSSNRSGHAPSSSSSLSPRVNVSNSPAAFRVYSALTLEKLSMVLQFGWSAVKEAICFSRDPRIATLLASTVGDCVEYDVEQDYRRLVTEAIGSGGSGHSLDGDDIASELDSLYVDSPNRSSNSSKNSSPNKNKRSQSNTIPAPPEMKKLDSALEKNIIVLLSCKLLPENVAINTINSSINSGGGGGDTAFPDNIPNIHVPVSDDLRSEMVRELRKAKKAQMVSLEYATTTTTTTTAATSAGTTQQRDADSVSQRGALYIVPSSQADLCTAIDFVCLAISPPAVEEAPEIGTRSLEGKLELLLLPTNRIDHTAHILPEFHAAVSAEIRQYLDKMLEELDEETAQALLRADSEVSHKEGVLKHVREQIEEERRTQEGRLRHARANGATPDGGAGEGLGGGGPSERNLHGGGGGVQKNSRQSHGKRY